MTLPPIIKCKQCGRQISKNIAGSYCSVCGYSVWLVVLLIMLSIGCDETRRTRPNPDKHDVVVVIDTASVKNIHRQSALVRADAYDKVADAVTAGTLKTVNDVVAFMNPMLIQAGQDYTKDINKLRKARLHDSDDELPPDAADVFRKFAKEYRDAAK